ncbi:uncharacterized protein LOC131229323 [Magnolia sinica]|uniref:uncharacterized protein LOC131229323 n=1 Tax=Magnolia sinica TaxID=86752 RepID=UPI00265987E7|nr:uncharacterized protein LOC131229323 [Magnolia sinica]
MKGDFRQMIPLPRRFIRKYEKDLSSIALLKDPNGKVWHVGLKRSAGRVFLQNGWPEFVEHHSLCNRHVLVLKYKGNSMFEVLIFDNSAGAKKHEESSSSKCQDPNYESESSIEILGVCTPHKAHLTKQPSKRRGGGRIPLLRSHGPPVMPNVMETETKCNKRRNRNEELLNGTEMRSSKWMGNVLEPRQSTHLKSAQPDIVQVPRLSTHLKSAQPDRVQVPKLPQEVELNNHKRKDGNEDPSFQSVNLSTASEGSFPHGACNGILMDAIENKNQQPIARSTHLKPAQSDMQHVQKLPQEVESNHYKRKDGNEDPSFQSVNLSTTSEGFFPHEVCNRISMDAIENKSQQPIRRSTRLKSAQSDMQHVQKLPQEVESNHHKRKDGNEDPSFQSVNLSTASEGSFPHEVCNHISMDAIENKNQQPIRRSTCLKSAQSDMQHVQKLPQEVESNHHKRKNGNEDPSFQSVNLSTASKGSFPHEVPHGILTDEIENENWQPIRRSTHLKSAQSDTLHVPKLPQEVKSNQSKQNDGNEGPSFQAMNLSTDSRGCFPRGIRNDVLTDEIKNENQQPIRKWDGLGELRRSIRHSLIQASGREVRGLGDVIESNRVEQNTTREDFSFYPKDLPLEGEIQNRISWNKAAIECIQPSNGMDNVTAPLWLERIKSFQSNGKKHEESNYNKNCQDSNYDLENSVEILGVRTAEGEGDNLRPIKRKGGRIPFLRSHGPPPKSCVMEIESKCNKRKNRSEDLFIEPEVPNSKQKGDVLEPRRSTRLNSVQSNIPHAQNLCLQVESNHHKQKDGDEYLSFKSVNLSATSKGSSPREVRDGILTDDIKNEKQQPIRKQCSLGVQRQSIRLRSIQFGGREVRGLGDVIESKHVQQNTAREEFSLYPKDPVVEYGVQNGISCNKVVIEGLQLSKKRNNVTAPRRSERVKSFQSDGKRLYGSVHECGPDCKKIHDESEQTPLCTLSEEFSTTVENQRTESDKHVSPSKNVEHLQGQGHCVDMTPPKSIYYRFISKRRPVTAEERHRAKEEARKFNSNNPFFVVVMPASYVYCRYFMYIPHKFAEDYIPREVRSITLADLDGKRWPVTCIQSRYGAGLGKGWAAFVWKNNLEEGDVCVFELVNREKFELRVLISRVVEEVVPFVRASEIKQDRKVTSS